MTAPVSRLQMPLRPYQVEARRAVVESVRYGVGRSFSIEIARQGGKNELSAQIELELLLENRDRDAVSIKAAPTFDPQAKISLQRLWDRICDAGLERWARREGSNAIRLGRARQLFLSAEAASNVVGHTADLLLEIDEAQDVSLEKFDKEFAPMAAANAATTVFYGTAWDDAGLLERARQAHLAQERLDGLQRHFEYDWQVVARDNPAYARYVENERMRLGEEHPLFLTQYCLRPVPGAGRLLGRSQLALLEGAHSRLEQPAEGEVYVAGLDIAGESDGAVSGRQHDTTVLTIARVLTAAPVLIGGGSQVEVVAHYAWNGAGHAALQNALLALLQQWRVQRLVVDATGIGEPVASVLATALGRGRVDKLKLTAESKSRLGYALLAAVNGGRLRLYVGGEHGPECRRQLGLCRAVYRPNQMLSFFVDEAEGHDDYVVSLALAIEAASSSGPRRAVGRAG